MYYSAAGKIERQGGRNLRVILDYELKKRVYHDIAKLGSASRIAARKKEIAERHGLQLVRGKIPLPDLRIEYETRDGEMARVDLELGDRALPWTQSGRKSARRVLYLCPRAGCCWPPSRVGPARTYRGDFVPMNLPTAHIERIKDLGYTDSEARFLYIVAVFSGYFTLGQFRAFTGSGYGKRPASFAQKLLKQGHATVRDYLRERFHLPSLFQDRLRSDREGQPPQPQTSTRLISCAPGWSSWTSFWPTRNFAYFETEQDKVIFFCEQLGVCQGLSSGQGLRGHFTAPSPPFAILSTSFRSFLLLPSQVLRLWSL